MDEIESLCRLCEAVETAGADIAPTYAEYVQLGVRHRNGLRRSGTRVFPSVVPGVCQVRTGTCRTDILQCTYYPAWMMSIWALHSSC